MPLQYSCFFSYRHCHNELGRRIIGDLFNALSSELDKPAFLDTARMQPGYRFNEALSNALCHSGCLVVVFTPTYFSADHSYCAREYKAMEWLENERLRQLSDPESQAKGLIVPVVFRGWSYLPPEIKDTRLCHNFDNFLLSHEEIGRHPEFAEKVRDIADYIYDRCLALESLSEDPCRQCGEFSIPTESRIRQWLLRVASSRPTFPGRTEAS